MKEVDIQPMREESYVYIKIENCIKNVLQCNSYSYDTISLKIKIDGLPLFTSTALDFWPILVQFDKFLPSCFVLFFVLHLMYCIYYILIVQHTPYFSCKRFTRRGFLLKARLYLTARKKILLKEMMLILGRMVTLFLSTCHQLADSPLARLTVTLKKGFSLDYMQQVCLGVVRRMLHCFKGCFKGISSGRLSLKQLTELSNKLTQLNGNFLSGFSCQPRTLI